MQVRVDRTMGLCSENPYRALMHGPVRTHLRGNSFMVHGRTNSRAALDRIEVEVS
jgi:hypothetical protein